MSEPRTTELFATQDDVQLSRKLRSVLGHEHIAGTCEDCGGLGMVPSIDATIEAERSLWRPCPTCLGNKVGGRA